MSEMTDEQRFWFLQDLDEADATVTDWEADFLGNILTNGIRNFTAEQRRSIDQMYDRYTGRGVV